MPVDMNLGYIPAGYSLSATKGGGKVKVAVEGFYSSEDGDEFIQMLEGFPDEIVKKLNPSIKPSQIDHLIVIINKDKTAIVYVNEVSFIGKVQVKRSCKKGDPIYSDDIADIESLLPENVNIPNDSGFLILISVGWRKGLYFNFWPIQQNDPQERDFDVHVLLGRIYSYLMFQNRFKISDDEWEKIIGQKWFPFISLNSSLINEILNHAKNSWDIDELLTKIQDHLDTDIDRLEKKWLKLAFLKSHHQFIQKAISHYKNGDYISSISVLYPRIEGIMREFHQLRDPIGKITQKKLIDSIIKAKDLNQNPYSVLLPEKFREFLINVYFENFNPNSDKPLSRHSVSHGVAEAETFSLKGALIGFLCLDQLTFYLSGRSVKTATKKSLSQNQRDRRESTPARYLGVRRQFKLDTSHKARKTRSLSLKVY